MPKRKNGRSRRQYSDELKAEAVQVLLDGIWRSRWRLAWD